MNRRKWILLADDNENDADLALRAWSANQASEDLILARDGAEALDCLHGRGACQTRAVGGLPALVLLDLKMPRIDGLEVLREVRADPRFNAVPVVMFTSSREETDMTQCYELGANAFVVKPLDFKRLITVLRDIHGFWLNTNELPADNRRHLEDPPRPAVSLPALAP